MPQLIQSNHDTHKKERKNIRILHECGVLIEKSVPRAKGHSLASRGPPGDAKL